MGKKANNYIFPATVTKGADNYGVYFHDMPGCIATGETLDDALRMAKDGLALHLWGMEQDGDPIPLPTPFEKIPLKKGEMLCLLDVNMMDIRAQMDHRPVKKTLTIPYYLNEMAEERHFNFSQVLQSALRERLLGYEGRKDNA